ncbi:hypothetical protein [Paracoccus sulfuroxidans]|uniref:hypothetical protein n=1 Tax=Paracoccus sulfuroxidans TaxID=384678 RepID=UPI003BB0683B
MTYGQSRIFGSTSPNYAMVGRWVARAQSDAALLARHRHDRRRDDVGGDRGRADHDEHADRAIDPA